MCLAQGPQRSDTGEAQIRTTGNNIFMCSANTLIGPYISKLKFPNLQSLNIDWPNILFYKYNIFSCEANLKGHSPKTFNISYIKTHGIADPDEISHQSLHWLSESLFRITSQERFKQYSKM